MKLLLVLLCFVTVGIAQDFEYGKPSDLKGLKKVFIGTGMDMEVRGRIVSQLEKAALGVEFLDKVDEAEMVLIFRDQESDHVTGISGTTRENPWGSTTNATVVKVPLIAGEGRVFVGGADKPRLVLSVKNSQQSRLEKRPSTKFANAFIKAYREANGLKK